MPVTIKPASHSASNILVLESAQGAYEILETALGSSVWAEEIQESKKILQSSFIDANLKDSKVLASANGLVHTAIEANNKHHHLTIRPEDVWFAILSQLNIWGNTIALEGRVKLFLHNGKKNIKLDIQNGELKNITEDITHEMEKNVTDPELREWIIPAFTTTTATDAIVASTLMLGAISNHICDRAFREYGLPSVTLLGEQSDWEELYKKLDKLETFGTEPAQFGSLLKPVISRFIKSFEDPRNGDVVKFWGDMINDECGKSGRYEGWISAFCFWSTEGDDLNDTHIQFRGGRGFILDGIIYHTINPSQIQPGYASVPVKVNDSGKELDAIMIAGSVRTEYGSSDRASTGSGADLDSASLVSGWWIFVNKDDVEEMAEASETSGGKLAGETESTTSATDHKAVATPEDGSGITPTSSVQNQSLFSRLTNLFSRTDISK